MTPFTIINNKTIIVGSLELTLEKEEAVEKLKKEKEILQKGTEEEVTTIIMEILRIEGFKELEIAKLLLGEALRVREFEDTEGKTSTVKEEFNNE